MTDDEIRIAVAVALGWKWYRRPATGPWAAKPHRALYHPGIVPEYTATLTEADMTERQCNEVFLWREGNILDYSNDLNAMHEIEKTLERPKDCYDHKGETGRYEDFLCGLVGADASHKWLGDSFKIAHATARQRAEAFLKAKGLWKE